MSESTQQFASKDKELPDKSATPNKGAYTMGITKSHKRTTQGLPMTVPPPDKKSPR